MCVYPQTAQTYFFNKLREYLISGFQHYRKSLGNFLIKSCCSVRVYHLTLFQYWLLQHMLAAFCRKIKMLMIMVYCCLFSANSSSSLLVKVKLCFRRPMVCERSPSLTTPTRPPSSTQSSTKAVEHEQAVQNEVLRLVEQKRFDADAKVCAEWVTTVIRGLNLFHRYERVFLGGAIALSCQLGAAHVLVYHEKNERFKRCRLPTNKVRHGYRLRHFAAAIRSTPAQLQLRLLPASRLPVQRVLEHFVC
jgi:hypothetical protein